MSAIGQDCIAAAKPNGQMESRRTLKHFLPILKGLGLNSALASACEKYLAKYYKHLQWLQWRKGSPEWFDHRIDLYRWPYHLNPHWLERGIYSKEVMFPGCKVLDLASGDGFYAKYFYAATGAKIDCVDINPNAIYHSKKYHNHARIRHFLLDVLADDFPRASYDVICFDGAIDHFPQLELSYIIRKIKKSLGHKGVLTGFQQIGYHSPDDEHPISYSSVQEVVEQFSPHFRFVKILTSDTPGRTSVFIRCSDKEKHMDRFCQR